MSDWDKPIFDVYVNEEYHYTEIIEGIVLGTVEGANCIPLIDKFGIKRILTVGTNLEKGLTDRCEYMAISIYDSRNEDIYQFFENTYKYIDNKASVIKLPYLFIARQKYPDLHLQLLHTLSKNINGLI